MQSSNILILSRQGDKILRDLFRNDQTFNHFFPTPIRKKATAHWTPLEIATYAAKFLASENGARVLDIGSGVGKFCLTAAYQRPDAMFYGIEQRKDLVEYAIECNRSMKLHNVRFIHGNFTQIDFSKFDHFYFFNSFYENLEGTDKIDDSLEYSLSLYNYYNRYLFKQLEKKPRGTKIVTFHSLEGEIPPGYYTVKTYADGMLKCWIKV